MAAFDGLLATDEDIAAVAGGDYALVVPRWSNMASGSDGVFSSAARWDLSSSITDFVARGITRGHVCVLGAESAPSQDIVAVASVVSNAVTLRRVGQADGEGQPPGPVAGQVNQVYRFPTVRPLLVQGSREMRRMLRIKEDAWLEAATDLTDAVVLFVLARLYLAQWRDKTNSAWKMKADEKRDELKTLVENLNQTYGSGSVISARPTSGVLSSSDPVANVSNVANSSTVSTTGTSYFRTPRVGD